MARPHVIARLKRLWIAYRKRQQAGFTLIELLVAMFIGSIITVSLLALVVQLVDVNQRDASRSETQRDMQAAMNYISQELREAVFVYDGDCLQGTIAAAAMNSTNFASECPGVVNYIPAGMSTISAQHTPIPVLAFWRADQLPQDLIALCSTNQAIVGNPPPTPPAPASPIDGIPCVSGRTYTLVVYALVDDTSSTDVWQGRARLVRYQLNQFTSASSDGSAMNAGYVDPLSSPNSGFQQWPLQLSDTGTVATPTGWSRPTEATLNAVIGAGNAAVLVDYVDDGQLAVTPTCVDRIDNTVPIPPNPYAATPRSDALFNPSKIRSFYACVRGKTYGSGGVTGGSVSTPEASVNQEVQVFLVGNVQGRPGFPVTAALPTGAIESQAFPLQTRVLSRGIISKSPKS